MKMTNKKGFTLAELLIVVAIIAVLVAVAIPVFTTQLEKSREATDAANLRSSYAEAMTEALTATPGTVVDGDNYYYVQQTQSGWIDVGSESGLTEKYKNTAIANLPLGLLAAVNESWTETNAPAGAQFKIGAIQIDGAVYVGLEIGSNGLGTTVFNASTGEKKTDAFTAPGNGD